MGKEITEQLLHQLVTGSWAEGTFTLAVAAAIEHDEQILLVGPSNDDFESVWQLPNGLVLPGESLLDALDRVVSLTTGLTITEVTAYDVHHDDLVEDEVVRTFVFTVTVAEPTRICRSAHMRHHWSSDPIIDSLVNGESYRPSASTTPTRRCGPTWVEQLSDELRAHASGILCAEAAIELLISQQSWINRRDFIDHFVDRLAPITSQSNGPSAMAIVDWARARAALDAGTLLCSSGEGQLLAIAASLAQGIPVDLRDALTGLDTSNTEFVRRAISHAADHRR